jgi:hypothetical protein
MSDFMAELLKSAKDTPSKITAKPVVATVETNIESTKFVDGEKVKEVTPVTYERKEVQTSFVREKTVYISFDTGATINLSNFNMGKAGVSISMPVGMEMTPELLKKIDGTYQFAKSWAESKLGAEVKELLKLRG